MNPELEEMLSALLDGELPPDETAALRAEIARSPELSARLASLLAVDRELRALPVPSLRSDLRARVGREIRAGTSPDPRASWSRASRAARRWLAAGALAAAAAAIALLVLPQEPREESPLAQMEPVSPAERRGVEELAEAEDLPVIEVLDVLAELDELEQVGSG